MMVTITTNAVHPGGAVGGSAIPKATPKRRVAAGTTQNTGRAAGLETVKVIQKPPAGVGARNRVGAVALTKSVTNVRGAKTTPNPTLLCGRGLNVFWLMAA